MGFQVPSFGTTGIPDIAFAAMTEYYAFDAGKWCKERAKLIHRAFACIGIRTWIQQELNWQAPTNPQPAPTKPEPALNPETVELRSVVPHPQVIGGLVDASQFMITAVGLLNQKVEQLDAFLQRQEQTRRLVEEDFLSVKPSVPAPPKTDRKALIGYIRKWCYLTQVAYETAWATLYAEVELRCCKCLKSEVKRLESAGKKNVKKLDAIESLGLLQQAMAIAKEAPTLPSQLPPQEA